MVPIIISGKSKSGVLAGRWQMLCYKVLSYQHRPMSGTPKQPNEAVQTTFQSTKYVGGPSSQACLTDIEKIQEFQVFGLLAGWVKMSPKETSPGHLLNNTRANQTSKWTNTYPTNDNQSHLGAFRHIRPTLKNQNFWLFGHWVGGGRSVKIKVFQKIQELIFLRLHMNRGYCPKRWKFFGQKWASGAVGATQTLSLSQGKVKVGFWPSVANVVLQSSLISTLTNVRRSQTTKWSITDHFSINQNHQGPSQRRLTDIWKIQDFDDFQWGGRWVGGQLATFSKCPGFNFPKSPYGQRVLSQEMKIFEEGLEQTVLWGLLCSYHYLREK